MLTSSAQFNQTNAMEYIVAPFWRATNAYSSRSVSYEIHTNQTSLTQLDDVSKYIRQKEKTQFRGVWMLVAEWNSVDLGNVMNLVA